MAVLLANQPLPLVNYSPVAWTLGPVYPRQGLRLRTCQGKPTLRRCCGVPWVPLVRKKSGHFAVGRRGWAKQKSMKGMQATKMENINEKKVAETEGCVAKRPAATMATVVEANVKRVKTEPAKEEPSAQTPVKEESSAQTPVKKRS